MQKIVTKNTKETQQIGANLAQKVRGGEIICLEGNLGTGKTTFTQGLIKSLGAKGPYTSPTFLIIKEYILRKTKSTRPGIKKIYHIDAYRIGPNDMLNLGWKEIINNKESVAIIEWSDRIKKILPPKCLKAKFKWLGSNQREIVFTNYPGNTKA